MNYIEKVKNKGGDVMGEMYLADTDYECPFCNGKIDYVEGNNQLKECKKCKKIYKVEEE